MRAAMNCNDVCRLLDERQVAELTAAEGAELEAHVAGCAECARQCSASEETARLRATVPPLPASLHEQARRLHAACESAETEHVTRRPVILGGLLLLGGAATMLAGMPRSMREEPAADASPRSAGRPGYPRFARAVPE